jgi:hypothetical protein
MATPVQGSTLIELTNPTIVNGDIFITAVVPPTSTSPASLMVSGSGAGFFATANQITLQPTAEQTYPIVYNLTLNFAEGVNFSFAMPVGQLSLLEDNDTGTTSGFLLNSSVLNIYHGTQTSPPLPFLYNLALNISDGTTTFMVDDPTIVFEPPEG